MAKHAKGYSLTELIIVVAFIGAFAAVAVPRINFSAITKQKADTVARRIASDLRRTRRLAISDAASNSTGYKMSMIGGATYTGYEIVNLSNGQTVDTLTIDSEISCTGGQNFSFGPLGNLTTPQTQLGVEGSGKALLITVTPATGMIICNDGAIGE